MKHYLKHLQAKRRIIMDKERLKDSIQKLTNKFGKDSIVPFGKGLRAVNINLIPTNLFLLDEMLCGGLPEGRLIEIYGHNGVGKTTLCYYLCSQFEFSAFIDAEGTFDEERAKLFNVSPNLIISRPNDGEEAIEQILEFVKAEVPLIVIDSAPCLYPSKQQEAEIGKEDYSPVARLISQQLLPKLIPILKKSKSIVVIVNQLRVNISSNPFVKVEPFITKCGESLRYAFSIRIEIVRKGWLGSSKDTRYGLLQAYRVAKSKIATPFKTCEFPFVWDYGYCETMEEAKEIRKQLIAEKRKASRAKTTEREI